MKCDTYYVFILECVKSEEYVVQSQWWGIKFLTGFFAAH